MGLPCPMSVGPPTPRIVTEPCGMATLRNSLGAALTSGENEPSFSRNLGIRNEGRELTKSVLDKQKGRHVLHSFGIADIVSANLAGDRAKSGCIWVHHKSQ